jgi:hypothetical protein
MPILVRRVNKAQVWADAVEPSCWQNGNFPFAVLSELVELRGSGLSFFEIKSSRDTNLKRIAAALRFDAKPIESIEFRGLKLAKVQQLGLVVRATLGNTKDGAVNQLHRELAVPSGPQAVKLAREMCKFQLTFGAREVANFIVASVIDGRLPFKDMGKDLLHSLKHYDAVKLVPLKLG